MNPYIFWLIVAVLVAFFQMFNKLVQYRTSAKFWKNTAFQATERYNQMLVKQSMKQALSKLDKIKA
ncbi:MAG: hypothetical protein Tp1111SUR768151_18 [Prokaryotic dsDNA virus sp.]|nr:MAG: hypothetical protein Tp1111SUR768151_18 [Prokaryotic dsDNA virus sp.]|tara:strand:+ start:1276 stop:1473 length:198 start_codon:yes stop_codon:yes gene_type:complete